MLRQYTARLYAIRTHTSRRLLASCFSSRSAGRSGVPMPKEVASIAPSGPLALPVNVPHLLSTETNEFTARQVLSAPNLHLSLGNPISQAWDMEVKEVLASAPAEAGNTPGDMEEFIQFHSLCRGVAMVIYDQYCEKSSFKDDLERAALTTGFASMVAEKMFALTAFSRTDLLIKRQYEIDDRGLGFNQQDGIGKLPRSVLSSRLPTHQDIYMASGIVPRLLKDVGMDKNVRLFPSFHIQDAFRKEHEDKTWTPARMDDLLPSWEQMEHVLQTYPLQSSPFKKYLSSTQQYEVLTREFVTVFSDYLFRRASAYASDLPDRPLRILEVGAGSGALLHHVKRLWKKQSPRQEIEFFSTDAMQWGAAHAPSKAADPPVQKLDYKEAIDKLEPDIVVCAWTPPNEDWSAAMRAQPSVCEYILLGEANGGVCGSPWATWGLDRFAYVSGKTEDQAPYAQEGFVKREIESVSSTQICKNDTMDLNSRSKCMSFVRQQQ